MDMEWKLFEKSIFYFQWNVDNKISKNRRISKNPTLSPWAARKIEDEVPPNFHASR